MLGGLLCARPHSGHHEVRLGGFPQYGAQARVCALREISHVLNTGMCGFGFWGYILASCEVLARKPSLGSSQVCCGLALPRHDGGRARRPDGAGESAVRSRSQSRMKRMDSLST